MRSPSARSWTEIARSLLYPWWGIGFSENLRILPPVPDFLNFALLYRVFIIQNGRHKSTKTRAIKDRINLNGCEGFLSPTHQCCTPCYLYVRSLPHRQVGLLYFCRDARILILTVIWVMTNWQDKTCLFLRTTRSGRNIFINKKYGVQPFLSVVARDWGRSRNEWNQLN